MDFAYTEEQRMLRDLAREILEAEAGVEVCKRAEEKGSLFDPVLWSKLADANLLGLAVPEAQGGMGYGMQELCILLEEVGRTVAPAPVWTTLVGAGLGVARFGSEAQRAQWLEGLVEGRLLLSAALDDEGSDDPAAPATRAEAADGGWRLHGVKTSVGIAAEAVRILVPAGVPGGVGLFLLDPKAEGVRCVAHRVSHRDTLHRVELDDALVEEADVLPLEPAEGAYASAWLHDAGLIGTCALQVGVSERALEITAGYARERVQFGTPIGSFQAVQHRLADAFIDLQSMRATLGRAAYLLDVGKPAARAAMIAKFWAAEGGARIASTAQHIHAGHGVDLDYVIHRYFIWTKALELSLGAATPQLVRLGREMARRGPEENR